LIQKVSKIFLTNTTIASHAFTNILLL